MPKRFISIKEVLKFLGISRPTVYRFIEKGMPNYRVGRRLFFDPDELTDWIKGHRNGPVPKLEGNPPKKDNQISPSGGANPSVNSSVRLPSKI